MNSPIQRSHAATLLTVMFAVSCGASTPEAGPGTPRSGAVQPGAPGEGSRPLSAAEMAGTEYPGHTEADVAFMQGMMIHHAQALVMTELAATRGGRDIRLLARRIELSQDDEMLLMSRWLEERGETVPAVSAHAERHGEGEGHGTEAYQAEEDHRARHEAHHGAGDQRHPADEAEHGEEMGHHGLMPGMLTDEELDRLAAASGSAFDRLFLEGMIKHHEGAITMVAELFSSPGAGQEGEIFQFASHVEADQNIEILRMQGMLRSISSADR